LIKQNHKIRPFGAVLFDKPIKFLYNVFMEIRKFQTRYGLKSTFEILAINSLHKIVLEQEIKDQLESMGVQDKSRVRMCRLANPTTFDPMYQINIINLTPEEEIVIQLKWG
jgi:hypothetical protein